MKTCQYYVGGKWQYAAGGATFEIRKPFSGEPLLGFLPLARRMRER
jgi:hypothetical protein